MPDRRSTVEIDDLRRQQLAEQLRAECIPYYEVVFRRLWPLGGEPLLPAWQVPLAAAALALLPYLLVVMAASAEGQLHLVLTNGYLLANSGLVLAGLLLLSNAYRGYMAELDDLLRLCRTETQLTIFRESTQRMWDSRQSQLAFSLAFGLGNMILGHCLPAQWPTAFRDAGWLLKLAELLHGMSMFIWISPGVWLAFASLSWMHRFVQLDGDPKEIRRFFPFLTAGLRSFLRVSATLALSFSLECTLALSYIYLVPWQQSSSILLLIRIAQPMLMIPLMTTFIGYPMLLARRVVETQRDDLLSQIEDRMVIVLDGSDPMDQSHLTLLQSYFDLAERIRTQSGSVASAAIVYKYFSSLIVPIVAYALQNLDIGVQIWAALKDQYPTN